MNKKILTAVLAVAVLLIVLFLAFAIDHRENSVSDPDGSAVSNSSDAASEVESADVSDTTSEQESVGGESDASEESTPSEEDSSAGNNDSSVPNEASKEESKRPETSENNSEDTSEEASEDVSKEVSEEISEDASEEESLPPVKEPDTSMTYAEYIALSAEEQQAHFESFASVDDFFAWYNAAKKEYDDEQSRVEVSGDIDIGDIIGGKN